MKCLRPILVYTEELYKSFKSDLMRTTSNIRWQIAVGKGMIFISSSMKYSVIFMGGVMENMERSSASFITDSCCKGAKRIRDAKKRKTKKKKNYVLPTILHLFLSFYFINFWWIFMYAARRVNEIRSVSQGRCQTRGGNQSR